MSGLGAGSPRIPGHREFTGNFFFGSDKNIIPVNDLRGEFPPSLREFYWP